MRVSRYLMLLAFTFGCGGGSTGPGTTSVFTSLAVSPARDTIAGAPGGTSTLVATPLDQNGSAISGLGSATWQSSDATIATVNNSGVVTSVSLGGPVTITASLTANGITKQGTAAVTVIDIPTTAAVTATTGQQFTPQQVDIKAGGTVTWTFQSLAHNVTFNAPQPAGTPANIPTQSNSSDQRQFTQAGTFAYHCTIHPGMTGSVVVH